MCVCVCVTIQISMLLFLQTTEAGKSPLLSTRLIHVLIRVQKEPTIFEIWWYDDDDDDELISRFLINFIFIIAFVVALLALKSLYTHSFTLYITRHLVPINLPHRDIFIASSLSPSYLPIVSVSQSYNRILQIYIFINLFFQVTPRCSLVTRDSVAPNEH